MGDCTKHGGHEQGNCRRRDQGDPQVHHLEEWQHCPHTLRRPHTLAHQPIRQVHHWRSSGRCRPHRTQDHHRHLRRMGCPWWWCFLRQGPNQGRPICSIHLPSDGQVC